MGLFRKKTEQIKPMTSVTNESYEPLQTEEEQAQQEQEIAQSPMQQPVQVQEIRQPAPVKQVQVARPQAPKTPEFTEEMLIQVLDQLDVRISNIEARLFRRGL